MLRKIGSGLSALVLAAACASAPKKEPEVIFLDVFDAVPHFRQKYGCVGVAITSDESYEHFSDPRKIFQQMAQRGIPLSEAAVENYKKGCSPDTNGVRTVAYQGTFAIAFNYLENGK